MAWPAPSGPRWKTALPIRSSSGRTRSMSAAAPPHMKTSSAASAPHCAPETGALVLDTSSSEPWLTEATARRLADAGVAMVDAPVSGAEWGAKAAELVFMCGGAAADVERVRPLLEVMGKAVFHLGPIGAGHAMKCLNNLVTAINFVAVAEGLAIGKRYGLDPAAMVDWSRTSTIAAGSRP